jgi:hypothetical protein
MYDVVIKDDLGCEITDQITIGSENSPNFISVAHTDLLCNGDINATITSTANGGTVLLLTILVVQVKLQVISQDYLQEYIHLQ